MKVYASNPSGTKKTKTPMESNEATKNAPTKKPRGSGAMSTTTRTKK